MKPSRWFSVVRAPVIVLAGAAHGNNVERYRRRWPRSRYLLFEPSPGYHPQLARFANDPLVTVIHKALSNERGEATFHVNNLLRTSSLYPVNPLDRYGVGLAEKEQITVETETLDDFCSEQEIDRIGFIELDAQGGELNALRGAQGLLKRKAIEVLMIEAFYTEVYQGVPLAAELHRFMLDVGYTCAGALPQKAWGDGIKKWNDLIYHV